MEAPMSDTPPPILSIISPAARQLLDGLTALDTAVIAAGQQSGLTTFHYGPRDAVVLTSIARSCLEEARKRLDEIAAGAGLDPVETERRGRLRWALHFLNLPNPADASPAPCRQTKAELLLEIERLKATVEPAENALVRAIAVLIREKDAANIKHMFYRRGANSTQVSLDMHGEQP
jgi:hypothetical protein